MKIICFIVVLIEIMKEVHSLKCYTHKGTKDLEPLLNDTTECDPGQACGYALDHREESTMPIYRQCLPKEGEVWMWVIGKCLEDKVMTQCACDTDHCNYNCSVGKCPLEPNKEKKFECDGTCMAGGGGTTPTDATTTNNTKTNQTDDNTGATGKDGPQPTDDSTEATGEYGPQPTEDGTGATGEDGQQPTEDRSGATAEDAEETQKPTGKASTISGHLRVVESNSFIFEILILATLVIRSFY